jgi:hypothetical protein
LWIRLRNQAAAAIARHLCGPLGHSVRLTSEIAVHHPAIHDFRGHPIGRNRQANGYRSVDSAPVCRFIGQQIIEVAVSSATKSTIAPIRFRASAGSGDCLRAQLALLAIAAGF